MNFIEIVEQPILKQVTPIQFVILHAGQQPVRQGRKHTTHDRKLKLRMRKVQYQQQ